MLEFDVEFREVIFTKVKVKAENLNDAMSQVEAYQDGAGKKSKLPLMN